MRTEPSAPRWTIVAIALILLAATGPVYGLLIHGWSEWNTDYTAVQAVRRMVWAALYVVMAGICWAWRAQALAALAAQPALPFAFAWFAASCLWSPSPSGSVLALAQFALIAVFGGAAALRLGPRGVLRAVRLMGLLVVAMSAAMAVISPLHAFGQHVNTGALRGVYIEKNHLAAVLSYAFVAALFEIACRPPGDRARPAAAAAAILTALVAARSSIALTQVALGGGLILAFSGLRGARFGGAATVCAALAALAAFGAAAPTALTLLGEDMTLNGRTELWALLWEHVERRPLLGHGFFGFWIRPEADDLRAALGWNARGAHNGWLTALLTVGIPGATLWALHWLVILRRGARALSPGGDPALAGCAALAFAHILWSLFESNQLTQMNWHAIMAGMAMALPVWIARGGAPAPALGAPRGLTRAAGGA